MQQPRAAPDRGADPVPLFCCRYAVPECVPDRRSHAPAGAGGGAGEFSGCRDLFYRAGGRTPAGSSARAESIMWLAHWMSMAGLALLVTAMTLAVCSCWRICGRRRWRRGSPWDGGTAEAAGSPPLATRSGRSGGEAPPEAASPGFAGIWLTPAPGGRGRAAAHRAPAVHPTSAPPPGRWVQSSVGGGSRRSEQRRARVASRARSRVRTNNPRSSPTRAGSGVQRSHGRNRSQLPGRHQRVLGDLGVGRPGAGDLRIVGNSGPGRRPPRGPRTLALVSAWQGRAESSQRGVTPGLICAEERVSRGASPPTRRRSVPDVRVRRNPPGASTPTTRAMVATPGPLFAAADLVAALDEDDAELRVSTRATGRA